jgi:hypothetical protein
MTQPKTKVQSPPPPAPRVTLPPGIRITPKVQKDKDGKWEISSPYLRELLAKKNGINLTKKQFPASPPPHKNGCKSPL